MLNREMESRGNELEGFGKGGVRFGRCKVWYKGGREAGIMAVA